MDNKGEAKQSKQANPQTQNKPQVQPKVLQPKPQVQAKAQPQAQMQPQVPKVIPEENKQQNCKSLTLADFKDKNLTVYLHFIRHGRSCENLAKSYESFGFFNTLAAPVLVANPPLSQEGEKQAKAINLDMIENIDFIGCSHLIRAFETAVDAIINTKLEANLYVLPCVNEYRQPVLGVDSSNEPDIKKLKSLVEKPQFKEILKDSHITPKFDIFDCVSSNHKINVDKSDYDNFINYVLPYILDKVVRANPGKQVLNLAIVSHGLFISNHMKKAHNVTFKDHINNTETWKEGFKVTENGIVYIDVNKCKDADIAAKTCSKTAMKIYDGKKADASEQFNYCLDKMDKNETSTFTSRKVLPYMYKSHIDQEQYKKTLEEAKKKIDQPSTKVENKEKQIEKKADQSNINVDNKINKNIDSNTKMDNFLETIGDKTTQLAKNTSDTISNALLSLKGSFGSDNNNVKKVEVKSAPIATGGKRKHSNKNKDKDDEHNEKYYEAKYHKYKNKYLLAKRN